MKNVITLTGVLLLAILAGCSNMVKVAERDTYAQPKWYADCAEAGSEGLLWWREDFVYACGGGQSRFFQAAEEQMYAIAMNHFARRVNGVVDSQTMLEFENNTRSTRTVISSSVTNTAIRDHVTQERATFRYAGDYYTFVRLKMNREIFDRLIKEAQDERAALSNSN